MSNTTYKNAMMLQFAELNLVALCEEFEELRNQLLVLSFKVRRSGYKIAVNNTEQSLCIRHITLGSQDTELFIKGHKNHLCNMRILIQIFKDTVGEK